MRTVEQDAGPNYTKRLFVVAGGAGALLMAWLGGNLPFGGDDSGENPGIACTASGEQTFTFGYNYNTGENTGVYDAAFAIDGIDGEGAPCFSDAVEIVEKELGRDDYGPALPQPGQTIEIPQKLTPVEN